MTHEKHGLLLEIIQENRILGERVIREVEELRKEVRKLENRKHKHSRVNFIVSVQNKGSK